MERRDVAGHQGSGESAYKCHSEGAHVLLRQLVSEVSAQILRSVMRPPADPVPLGFSPVHERSPGTFEPGRSGRDLQARTA
jgi:hypothetical protein